MDPVELVAAAVDHGDRPAVPLIERAAMRAGLTLLVWGHQHAAHRPEFAAEQSRLERERRAVRLRDLSIPLR